MSQKYDGFKTIEYYWNSSDWLGRRMLFLSGPRQVGKTTLIGKTLCTNPQAQFNWDHKKVSRLYRRDPDFFAGVKSSWIYFDEIHKQPHWKDILKGIYDTYKQTYHFVISGSARLDTFKRSGDSLVGRYFHTQLFPINFPDLVRNDFANYDSAEKLILAAADLSDPIFLDDLITLSGFPEPFFKGSASYYKRWSRQHRDLILSEDLRDLSRIVELGKLDHLFEMVRQSSGQVQSFSNLARDLETDHKSVFRWLEMLVKIQLVFMVPPYSKNIRRAYKKEKKYYCVDWSSASNQIFENYIACCLLRTTTLWEDRFGDRWQLYYLRTHDGTEIDFLICRDGKPWLLVEVKEGTPDIPRAAYRFSHELSVPCVIVTRKSGIFKKITGDHKQKLFCISWGKLGQLLA